MVSMVSLPGLGPLPIRLHTPPVHRGSTRKPVNWRRMNRKQAVKLFHTARRLDARTKVRGRHGGLIGHAGLQVLHALVFDFFNFATGQLDPSYDTIARKANLARSTVAEALKKLKALGIVSWVRRCSESYEDGRYELHQETNAYTIIPASEWADEADQPAATPAPDPQLWGFPAPSIQMQLDSSSPLNAALERLKAAYTAKLGRDPVRLALQRLAARLGLPFPEGGGP